MRGQGACSPEPPSRSYASSNDWLGCQRFCCFLVSSCIVSGLQQVLPEVTMSKQGCSCECSLVWLPCLCTSMQHRTTWPHMLW